MRSARRGARIPYEPALDGLRGVAVGGVLLYHAEVVLDGKRWFGAGFLGVDAFFVLSGFLITALLIVERTEDGGISLREFWMRRARRLLPALFGVVGFVVVYAAILAQPAELNQIRGDGLAALFYVANWKFILDGSSYFDLFRIESPFQHVWSLAIEEQWYLLWPLVALLILRRRPSPQIVLVVSGTLALASAAWMAYLSSTSSCLPFADGCDPVARVYYGTETRAQSLLVGSALAAGLIAGVSVRDFTARYIVPAVAAVAGLGLLYVWATRTDAELWYYRGGFLLMALAVGFVILAAVQPEGNIVRRALSFTPLRWLGIISYGVYLWHWPLFVLLSRRRAFLEDWSWSQITALRFGTTLAVATLSYLLVERPIRHGRLGARFRIAPVLAPATAVLLALALVASTARPNGPSLDLAEAEALPRRLPTAEELREGTDPTTRPPPPTGRTQATKVLIVGDSVAYSMAGGFTPELQRDEELLVWNQTVLFCELAEGARMENGEILEPSETCEGWKDAWRASVEEFDPDVSVLQVGAWEIFDRRVDGQWLVFGTPEYDEYFLGLLHDAVDVLAGHGATVVLLTSPRFERSDTTRAREWTQNEDWRVQRINKLFGTVAEARSEVVLLDLGSWLCPRNCLDKLSDGKPVRSDGVHFTDEGAAEAAAWLAPQLHALGYWEQL